MSLKYTFSALALLISLCNVQAQTCTGAPNFNVNLVGQPAGIWTSPDHSRGGTCCSSSNCTSFDVSLDPNAAMINLEILSGAVPSGSLYYKINCGAPIAVGSPICISVPSPFKITFCKPGNNPNVYKIISIAKPTFPVDATVRLGCTKVLATLGFNAGSISWTSIPQWSQPTGYYNSLLSSTTAAAPIYTPTPGLPAYIDYKICGTPQASLCGYVAVCDTVRIFNVGPITATVLPLNAGFCAGGSVSITASASGGLAPYTYIWKDQSNVQVGTGATYVATAAGTYALEVRDAIYDPTSCPALLMSIPVLVTQPPTVNPGLDQTVCTSSPIAFLTGVVNYATGGVWSGGSGTYSPNNTSLSISYTPTAGEILAGFVNLTLTSTGVGGGCTNSSATVKINYPPLLINTLPSYTLACNASTTNLTPVISGGISPYGYLWGNGATTSSISAGEGNYCVTITDAIGCTANSCSSITVPAALGISTSATDVTVLLGSDGTATANPSGGTIPYTYLWTPGSQTTQTATGLTSGGYTVLVTDANGCTIQSNLVVNEPSCADLSVTINATNVNCFGNSVGTATVVATGGGGPGIYSYSWNTAPVQTTAVVTGLPAGAYQVTVTSPNACTQIQNITITEPPLLSNSMSHTDASLVGGNNGTATATPSGGNGAYTFLWSNSASTQTATGLVAGGYTVTVTDANGCSLVDSVQVEEPSCVLLVLNLTAGNVSCFSGSDGTASADLLFGTAPYSYLWSVGGQTTSAINLLPAGNVSVIVTDALNCALQNTITITEPPVLSLALIATDVICNSANNGTLNLTVTGGTFPYTYLWSNNITVEDQENLPNGSYTVTVTDAKGCTASTSATINQPALLSAIATQQNVTCKGGFDGATDATVSGGISPYTYFWTPGNTNEDLTGLYMGEYILTVTDANGCISPTPLSILITEPDSVDVSQFVVFCPVPGSGVAQVDVTPIGGNGGPYSISFTDGVTYLASGDYSEFLPVGTTYSVIVKDGNNCVSSVEILVIDPEPFISNISFANCNPTGVGTATVTVTPSGGAGIPYLVSTDNGSSYDSKGDYIDTLAIGNTYQIIIKDTLGCISLPSTIVIPDSISLNVITSAFVGGYNISCNGLSDGSINLTASGGTMPYTFLWDNGTTTISIEDPANLSAGNYTLTITDANLCSKTLIVPITEPALLSAVSVISTDYNGSSVSCNGSSNGAIDLSVSGGSPAYIYVWSNSSSTEDISGLSATTYSVLITDANGCTATNSITLTEPAALTTTIAVSSNYNGQNISCNGLSDGSIDLTVAGGTTAYTYAWSNAQTTEDISGLSATTYSVLVTDANGCTSTQSITLTQPAALTNAIAVSSNYNGQNISCNGLSDGSIDLSVVGGTTAYTYAWSNLQTTEDISGLNANTYSVLVTDVNGCTTASMITINQPAVLSNTIAAIGNYNGQNISCNGLSNGAIDLSVSGGTTAYTYSWSNAQTTQDISGLNANTYSVLVTDVNGCTTTNTITLTQPAVLTTTIAVSSNYNGQNISCNGLSNGSINLSVAGGTAAYTYVWSNLQSTQDISGLSATTYSVLVTDANGCTSAQSITLTQPAALTNTIAVSSNYNGQNIRCNGLSNGSIDLSVSGGTIAYTYAWSNLQTTQDISGLNANTYSVLVTDKNGCTTTNSIIINQPPVLSNTIAVSSNYNNQNISCNGSGNGAINLSVSGGTTAYTYLWSNAQTTQDISGLNANIYSVLVTDANGCTTTNTITITQPAVLTTTIAVSSNYTGYNVSCFGSNNGSIDLTVAGGTPNYTYSWFNSHATQDITGLVAGTYSALVTDANGCTAVNSIMLNQPLPVNLSAVITNATCNGNANGGINLSASGGASWYNYLWSNGSTTQDITGIAAGSYSVVVTDVNGCTSAIINTVGQNQLLTVSAFSENLTCNKSNDGTLFANLSGGVAPYLYSWSNGSTTQGISGLAAGNYVVNIGDANNCFASSTFVITQPDTISATQSLTYYPNGFNVTLNGASDGHVDLNVTGGTSPYDVLWSTGDTTQDLNFVPAGVYVVQITDSNGCMITLTMTLTEPFVLELPTGFSPNGDGLNDNFVVHGLESYPDNNLVIYNRWGNLVFSQDNYKNDWSGKSNNGGNLPDATYFVVLKIFGSNEITLTGYVDLRR